MEVAERASIRVSMSMARERSMALMCIGCEMSEGLRELESREAGNVLGARCIRATVPTLIYRCKDRKYGDCVD